MVALRQCSPKLLVATAQRARVPGGTEGETKAAEGAKEDTLFARARHRAEVEIEVVSGRHMTTQNVVAASALKQHL